MSTKKIGTFQLGTRNVDLIVNTQDSSGCLWFRPNNKSNAAIQVGINGTVSEVCDTLLHEAMEFALAELRCRYSCQPGFNRGNDDYIFHVTHPQFSDACAMASSFQQQALLPLLKARKKLHDKVKKK